MITKTGKGMGLAPQDFVAAGFGAGDVALGRGSVGGALGWTAGNALGRRAGTAVSSALLNRGAGTFVGGMSGIAGALTAGYKGEALGNKLKPIWKLPRKKRKWLPNLIEDTKNKVYSVVPGLPKPQLDKVAMLPFVKPMLGAALNIGVEAPGISRGDQSVGGAAAGTGLGLYGSGLGNKLFKNTKGKLGTTARVLSGLAGGIAGYTAGSVAANKVAPIWRRKPQEQVEEENEFPNITDITER